MQQYQQPTPPNFHLRHAFHTFQDGHSHASRDRHRDYISAVATMLGNHDPIDALAFLTLHLEW